MEAVSVLSGRSRASSFAPWITAFWVSGLIAAIPLGLWLGDIPFAVVAVITAVKAPSGPQRRGFALVSIGVGAIAAAVLVRTSSNGAPQAGFWLVWVAGWIAVWGGWLDAMRHLAASVDAAVSAQWESVRRSVVVAGSVAAAAILLMVIARHGYGVAIGIGLVLVAHYRVTALMTWRTRQTRRAF